MYRRPTGGLLRISKPYKEAPFHADLQRELADRGLPTYDKTANESLQKLLSKDMVRADDDEQFASLSASQRKMILDKLKSSKNFDEITRYEKLTLVDHNKRQAMQAVKKYIDEHPSLGNGKLISLFTKEESGNIDMTDVTDAVIQQSRNDADIRFIGQIPNIRLFSFVPLLIGAVRADGGGSDASTESQSANSFFSLPSDAGSIVSEFAPSTASSEEPLLPIADQNLPADGGAPVEEAIEASPAAGAADAGEAPVWSTRDAIIQSRITQVGTKRTNGQRNAIVDNIIKDLRAVQQEHTGAQLTFDSSPPWLQDFLTAMAEPSDLSPYHVAPARMRQLAELIPGIPHEVHY